MSIQRSTWLTMLVTLTMVAAFAGLALGQSSSKKQPAAGPAIIDAVTDSVMEQLSGDRPVLVPTDPQPLPVVGQEGCAERRTRSLRFEFGHREAANDSDLEGPQGLRVPHHLDPQPRRGWRHRTAGWTEHEGWMIQKGPAVGTQIGRRPGTEQKDRAGGFTGREGIEGVECGQYLVHVRREERSEQRRDIGADRGTPDVDRREVVTAQSAAAER